MSTAILDNVIFCHQEESLWPLSEPSVLKKKFDDIFSATKFTKALDNIKSLRKENAQIIKFNQQELENKKVNKEKALRVRAASTITVKKIEKYNQRISALDEGEVTNLAKKIENINTEERKMEGLKSNIDKLDHENTLLSQNLTELDATMNVLDGNDKELRKSLVLMNEKNLLRRRDAKKYFFKHSTHSTPGYRMINLESKLKSCVSK